MERPSSLIDLYRIGVGNELYQTQSPDGSPTPEEFLAVHMVRNLRAFKPVEQYATAGRRQDAERCLERLQTEIMKLVHADTSSWKLVSLLGRHLHARATGLIGDINEMNEENLAVFTEMGGEDFKTVKESHYFVYLLVWLALAENDASFRATTPREDWERGVEIYRTHNMPDYADRLAILRQYHP